MKAENGFLDSAAGRLVVCSTHAVLPRRTDTADHMKLLHPVPVLAALAVLAAGCASTAHLQTAETHYRAGQYEEARAVVRAELDAEDDPARLEKSGHILDNLYAGSAAFMCGDAEAAAVDFRRAGEGIADQEASTFGSGYPTRAYDATMAANYRALSDWMQGDADAARVSFRLVADAQDKAEERNARAIRKEQDALEKRKKESKEELAQKNAGNGGGKGFSLSTTREIDSFQASFNDWEVYGDFQVPSTWFLDSVFALANAEDASDLEHASFAARKALSMAPSKPAREIFALAEKRADGKLSAGGLGRLFVVVFENGLGPEIAEKRFDIPFAFDGAVYNVSFALPELVRRNRAYPKLVVRDGAVSLGETELVGDLDRVAVREFKGRLPGIVASQLLEATVKVAIQIAVVRAAEKKGGAGAKLLASIALSALSSAVTGTDTRHWNLLPKEVQALVAKKPKTDDRTIGLWIPGGTAPLATVSLPERGLSVVYVKIPGPGLPPLVKVLGAK